MRTTVYNWIAYIAQVRRTTSDTEMQQKGTQRLISFVEELRHAPRTLEELSLMVENRCRFGVPHGHFIPVITVLGEDIDEHYGRGEHTMFALTGVLLYDTNICTVVEL